MTKKILSLTLFTLLWAPVLGFAQDDTDNDAAAPDTASNDEAGQVMEEVMVQGIRSSLADAIDIKRSHVGTMEAISTEDFGKFPDGNLAESLARVPGIAIDRSNVEGQKIAVRGFGPEFNLVTLNGRQMPTAPEVYVGGRSFNFGDIASPGVQAVEVFKSANSTLPSGGIGATVNMVTTKPLNVDGTRKHFSFNLVEDSTNEAGGNPFESTFLFATNQDDKWGFSFSGAYQERNNREEGTRENNWIIPSEMRELEGYWRVEPTNPAYTNNNARPDGATFYQEPTAYQYKDNDRVRQNAQLTFQYAWNDDVITTLDYTYSNVDFSAVGMRFGSWLGGWDTLEATINPRGVFTDVVVGNRGYDHELIFGNIENTNKSLGFNTQWQLNDAWALEFDAHHSTAEVRGGDIDSAIGFTSDIQATVTHTNGGASGINSFSYDTDFGPENFLLTNAVLRDGFKENEMDQIQIKAEWANLEGGALQSIQFGVSYLDSAFTKASAIGSFGAQGGSAADYDDALFERTSLGNFMNSFGPNIGTDYFYKINPQAALAAFIANNPGATDADGTVCCSAGPIDGNERVNETLESAYVQFNFATEVGDMPLDIVAGLRYESTDTESISLYAPVDVIRWDMIAGLVGVNTGEGPIDAPDFGSNSLILPSVAMSLGLDDNQVLRFSASKTMARPDLFALNSQVNIGSRDFFQLTAEAGNPDLDPLQSTNFDISYENYYAPGSYFAVNLFHKEIDDFIGTRTIEGVTIPGLTDPSQSAIGKAAMACVRAWVDAGRPQTGFPGDEGATGDCVSQQALWAQGWMNDQQHMGWVAVAMANGVDVSGGYPWAHGGLCGYDGWWRCDPGFIEGTASDPAAVFSLTEPYNLNSGSVQGIEVNVQHLFKDSPFGVQFNYTAISGGDVDVDTGVLGEQFLLPGLGDSGNFSVFYEDDRHTARLALNYRAETVAGFANYQQPLFVEEREQIDASYQFRYTDATTFFLEVSNVTDEPTRLYVRHPEMLFLSQDHGPIYKFGFRTNF